MLLGDAPKNQQRRGIVANIIVFVVYIIIYVLINLREYSSIFLMLQYSLITCYFHNHEDYLVAESIINHRGISYLL